MPAIDIFLLCISDGLEYRDLLGMCTRYQSHLRDTAAVVAVEQRALASRLKDLEMFSAGIAQQLIRRQERMQRALVQLEKVKEVTNTLEEIESSIEQTLPLLQRLNQLLPDSDRLEPFHLKEIEEGEGEREGQTVDDGVVSIDHT
ncbi:BLOC-1-related complex subunit 5 [Geodia barretti]|uniref:BLOC-1-related complex subunit 5 n=1 Tax=Geodia barretti TaxID=519541 RepID=A0AA35TKT3_GEOBA|nr:BLOC-1-related complex subunit 5 [Geodia barretti]